jgi:hypothetical protein
MPFLQLEFTGASRREIQKAIGRAKRVQATVAGAAKRGVEQLASEIATHELTGQTLGVVTGMLRRSVKGWMISSGGTIVVAVGVTKGPATAYARIHEEGGVIRGKGKRLAVPLPAARTRTGKPRFPGGPREAARKYPDLFLLKRPGRPPLLCRPLRVAGRKGGKVKGLEPLFVLLSSVRIPARHWLSEGVLKHHDVVRLGIERDLDALLREAA